MEGRAKLAERENDLAIGAAWYVERFRREKRLKPLGAYLTEAKPKKPQTPKQMLAALRALNARGAGMTFKRVPRQRKPQPPAR